MATTLTQQNLTQYQEDGYIVPDFKLFSDEKFAALKSHFESKLLELPKGERPESMDVPHFKDPSLFEWLGDESVLDMLEPILGPDIALFTTHFICKPSGDGRRVPWHEDSSYWRQMISPIEVVTVWVAIDPSTVENGCMQVVPRTHITPDSDYIAADIKTNVFNTQITPSQVKDQLAVNIELQPGHFSLHDGRLIHGSKPNTSDKRRCGYTMRYISTKTKFNQEKVGHYHGLYLLRGKDHAGNQYLDPSKSYPELVDNRKGLGGH